MAKKKVNYISNTRRDDTKILVSIIVAFLLVAWFCSPPGNKFLQICFWGDNVKYAIAKIVKPSSTNEYLHHRNNAVYLAKMYPTKDDALKEMNKACIKIGVDVDEERLRNWIKMCNALDNIPIEISTNIALESKFKRLQDRVKKLEYENNELKARLDKEVEE